MRASKKTTSLNNPAATKKGGFNLPSHDALAQILPKYHTLFNGEKMELHGAERPAERPEANKPAINQTYQVDHPHKRRPLHDFKDDPHTGEMTDLQTKSEVENYRSAMSKMAEDIIALRTQVVKLEADNSQLCADLSLHRDLGRDLLDDADINVMTKAEIAGCIASPKFKLASESSEAASQRARTQQLEHDSTQKSNSEKELRGFQTAQEQQHGDLQHHQSCYAKVETSEAAVKRREKTVEKMEKALDSKLRETNKLSGDKRSVAKTDRGETDHREEEREPTLAAENTRLREELDRIHRRPVPIVIHQSAQLPGSPQTKDALPVKEGLSLLNKLEKAEAKVQTLEAQLEENCTLWGKQKQEMLTQLSEHRHGFVRTSTTMLHNVAPVSGASNEKSVSGSLYQKSRQRKPKPAKKTSN